MLFGSVSWHFVSQTPIIAHLAESSPDGSDCESRPVVRTSFKSLAPALNTLHYTILIKLNTFLQTRVGLSQLSSALASREAVCSQLTASIYSEKNFIQKNVKMCPRIKNFASASGDFVRRPHDPIPNLFKGANAEWRFSPGRVLIVSSFIRSR